MQVITKSYIQTDSSYGNIKKEKTEAIEHRKAKTQSIQC